MSMSSARRQRQLVALLSVTAVLPLFQNCSQNHDTMVNQESLSSSLTPPSFPGAGGTDEPDDNLVIPGFPVSPSIPLPGTPSTPSDEPDDDIVLTPPPGHTPVTEVPDIDDATDILARNPACPAEIDFLKPRSAPSSSAPEIRAAIGSKSVGSLYYPEASKLTIRQLKFYTLPATLRADNVRSLEDMGQVAEGAHLCVGVHAAKTNFSQSFARLTTLVNRSSRAIELPEVRQLFGETHLFGFKVKTAAQIGKGALLILYGSSVAEILLNDGFLLSLNPIAGPATKIANNSGHIELERGDVSQITQSVKAVILRNGSVLGEVSQISGLLSISGNVAGSMRQLGGSVTVGGNVGGSILQSSKDATITIGGRVGGDIQQMQKEITVHNGVGGRIYMSQAKVTIFGSVGGDIQSNPGAVSVSGDVKGSLSINSGSVTIAGKLSGDILNNSAAVTVGEISGGQILQNHSTIQAKGRVSRISGNTGTIRLQGEVATIDGSANGTLEMIGGKIGTVAADFSGTIILKNGATIESNLSTRGKILSQ